MSKGIGVYIHGYTISGWFVSEILPTELRDKFLFLWLGDRSGDHLLNVLDSDYITITDSDFTTRYIPGTTTATFSVPDNATYLAADEADKFWYNSSDVLQNIDITDLITSTNERTFIRYLDSSPYDVSIIGILKSDAVLTTSEYNLIDSYFRLWFLYRGYVSGYGFTKDNMIVSSALLPLSASISDTAKTQVVILMNQDLDELSIPATTAFSLTGKTITNVSVSGEYVTLTVSVEYTYDDTISVDYTKPGINPLISAIGHIECDSFEDLSVVNNIYDYRFKITIDTTKPGSASDTFVLPCNGSGYNAYVDWGDGGAEQNITGSPGNVSHTYSVAGTYQIKIRGTFPRIYFHGTGDRQKLMTIDNWGDVVWLSMEEAFKYCVNMQGNWHDLPIYGTNVICKETFASCTVFNYSLENFITSAVNNIQGFLAGCAAFNTSIAGWDTQNVYTFASCFSYCNVFNQPVNHLNTAKGKSFANMFLSSPAFNKPVSNFDTHLGTAFNLMFYNCVSFNQSVANFNTSAATNLNAMFGGCTVFNQNVDNFDTHLVQNFSSMFYNATSFKQSLASFSLAAATTTTNMLYGCNINATGTTTNYDNTLVAWASADVPNSLSLTATNCKYSDTGQTARESLISDDLWTITDGGHI